MFLEAKRDLEISNIIVEILKKENIIKENQSVFVEKSLKNKTIAEGYRFLTEEYKNHPKLKDVLKAYLKEVLDNDFFKHAMIKEDEDFLYYCNVKEV